VAQVHPEATALDRVEDQGRSFSWAVFSWPALTYPPAPSFALRSHLLGLVLDVVGFCSGCPGCRIPGTSSAWLEVLQEVGVMLNRGYCRRRQCSRWGSAEGDLANVDGHHGSGLGVPFDMRVVLFLASTMTDAGLNICRLATG